MHRQRRFIWIFMGAMLALFMLASRLSGYYIEWLWFGNLGYTSVFWRSVGGRLLTGAASGLLFGGIIFLNIWLSGRGAAYLPHNIIPFPYDRWLRRRGVLAISALAGIFFGTLAGLSLAGQWMTFLLYFLGGEFGKTDPLFQKDVSFFVFSLPALNLIYQLLATALFLGILLSLGVYTLTGRVSLGNRWPSFHPWARKHLLTALGLFLFLKAGGYILSMYRLVYSTRGVAFGASYTDVHVDLPALKALAIMAVFTGIISLVSARSRNYRILVGALITLVFSSFLLSNVVPGVVQQFVVKPNEIAKETEYIKYNIAGTRDAYNLNRIKEREFPVSENLTLSDVRNATGTVENIRLWDWRTAKAAYQQLQGIRRYYQFDDIDVDRYEVNGMIRQVLISGREIDYEALPEKTWINQFLKYTHGYGIVMSPTSEVTPEGLPPLWIRDIPPVTDSSLGESMKVDRPEIYFGEKTDRYAIVNTIEKEFNYPQGDRNEYSTYAGHGGIPIGGLLNRFAFAVYSGDYNVLLSSALTNESRVLLNRNIYSRMDRIAPFLFYDNDPYLVLNKGRLYWIRDAYTITDAYPYSEYTRIPIETPMGTQAFEFNYIRNSVKVVVDAYNGDVRFYVADASDPLIQGYQKVFPGLFQPLSAMEPGLQAHLRYPEGLFLFQAEKYGKYHMQDPLVFYNKEDQWERPKEITGTKSEFIDPYYVIMELPGDEKPEYLLMMPFTPSQRTNMIAWLAARSDRENYGELVVFKFPKHKLILGPSQVEALISQDETIAEKMTLWGQQGSEVRRGNLLVIPLKDSVMYIEPIYLQSTNTKLPELKRIIGVYRDRVKMEESLDRMLVALFSGANGDVPPATTPTKPEIRDRVVDKSVAGVPTGDLIAEANRLYRLAQEALRNGDWTGYGEHIKDLGDVLSRMEESFRKEVPVERKGVQQ